MKLEFLKCLLRALGPEWPAGNVRRDATAPGVWWIAGPHPSTLRPADLELLSSRSVFFDYSRGQWFAMEAPAHSGPFEVPPLGLGAPQ